MQIINQPDSIVEPVKTLFVFCSFFYFPIIHNECMWSNNHRLFTPFVYEIILTFACYFSFQSIRNLSSVVGDGTNQKL